MDARRFDALARALTEAGSRRGLLTVLATLPPLGSLVARFDPDEAAARKNRRKRRQKPHKRASRRRKKQKQRKTRKQQKCTAHSKARTCANRCGTVKNNCKKNVDCGSCVCDPACPVCQTCNDRTGACEPDPSKQGDACGEPGQVCQPDGTCACDATSCAEGLRCEGAVCVCDSSSCRGCCDQDTCQPGTTDGACGTGGAACVACTGDDTCQAGVCTCTPTTCQAEGVACGTIQDGCGGTLNCGGCAGTTPVCEAGICVACQTHAECGEGYLCLADGACQACDVVCTGTDNTCDRAELETAMNAGGTVYVCPGRYAGTYFLYQADVTVIGAGDGDDPRSATILDAQQGPHVVHIAAGRTIALHRLHITGGFTSAPQGGAGILHIGDLLTMEDCTVSHNETQDGIHGAIVIGSVSQLVMTRCTIRDNSATNADTLEGAEGGGVFNNGDLEMTDCVIRDNTAQTAGGGLSNNGTAQLTRCRITENILTDGNNGGGIHAASTVNLTDSYVWGNSEPDCSGTVSGDGCGEAPPLPD